MGNKEGNKIGDKHQLSLIIGIGKSGIENNIAYLREHGFIERIGSKKNGYWQV